MNNRFLLVILLFLSIAIGCSKNSDDGNPQPISVDKSANLKTTGDSANEILSNNTFDKLQIEIAYVEGFRPTASAMTNFMSFLSLHSFKQEIDIVYQELPSPNEEKLTLEEIFDLEKENRTVYNDGSTLAIYIYFADAPSEDDKEEEDLVTLGAVYLNTSMVIYEDTIRTLASKSNLVSVGDVETATLNHEFGHLLGLVDLGSTPVNAHEDVDAENHCNVEECLMRAELQFGAGMKKMLENRASKGIAEAPGLGPECILDLQANGGK
ncbi:MAG: hypothetical protein KJN85_07630 [Maribacter sp.]|nr:hypothetical protein [Maribacter sp.]MBT8315959.1 hypothetical protein [Maribacter sp.]